jgi:uncharacterized membrane protein YccC
MLALTPRAKEAIKTALAMTIAYGVALSMDWPNPHWAGFAVAFISLSTVGQSLNKGLMRMAGTLLAAVFSLALIALFPQERWWFFLVLSSFVGLCTYLMGGSGRQYFWNVAGFVSLIVCMSSVPATENAFAVAVVRILETGLGILVYTLVTVLVWPTGTREELDAAVRRLAVPCGCARCRSSASSGRRWRQRARTATRCGRRAGSGSRCRTCRRR